MWLDAGQRCSRGETPELLPQTVLTKHRPGRPSPTSVRRDSPSPWCPGTRFHPSAHPPIHPSIPPSTHLFTHQFMHLFIHSSVHSFIHQFIQSSVHAFAHSLIHPFIHSFISLFIHSFMSPFSTYPVSSTCWGYADKEPRRRPQGADIWGQG